MTDRRARCYDHDCWPGKAKAPWLCRLGLHKWARFACPDCGEEWGEGAGLTREHGGWGWCAHCHGEFKDEQMKTACTRCLRWKG